MAKKIKTRKKRKPVKLNLGGGEIEIPGYVNIDRRNGTEAYPLNYPDNSVDLIRASHILEHFSFKITVQVLKDWVRALKPGGIMRIAVPDVEYIFEQYNSRTSGEPIEGYLMGGQVDENDIHFAIFDRRKLWTAMHAAGLMDIQPWVSKIQDCASMPVSANLQGKKPPPEVDFPAIDKAPRVAGAMSVPRLGFMANYFSAYQACLPLGITLKMIEGAYWHQALEECMEDVAEIPNPPDYVMTVDYDSVFEIENVRNLIRIMMEHPDIDALCPLQKRRNNEYPLLSLNKQNEAGTESYATWETFEPLSTQISTGHFGLTLIRVASLLDVPHPWFLPIPNKDGKWRDDRIDADVNFWKTWEKHGKTLHLANHIVIGHCELMVGWFDKHLKPLHQHIEDYNLNGRPANVWE